jgi:hypothetical protein
VTWCGKELGRGLGRSKKEAEVDAARSALASEHLPLILESSKPDQSASEVS